MLNIKTFKNQFVSDEKKEGYYFRSASSQILSLQELINEMASYNSTFTEADISGMLTILNTVVVKHLVKGYCVNLPFGSLRVNAKGTCANINESFSAGNGNHQIGFIFNATNETKAEVNSKLEYIQVNPDSTGDVKIYRICSLDANAKEIMLSSLKSGSKIRIHGRNLAFDLTDETQGVFLENETSRKRITDFNRKGSNIIDFQIPSDTDKGEYSVSVVAKPGKFYSTATFPETIEVETSS